MIEEMIPLKVKLLHPDAKMPSQAHNDDAGYDIYAIDDGVDVYSELGMRKEYRYTEYRTGISIEPPKGYHVELFPRSSITGRNLILKNSIGLIDNKYRGELICRFHKTGDIDTTNIYKKGERIAQMVIRKTINVFIMGVENLSDTTRGEGGFGSTGK